MTKLGSGDAHLAPGEGFWIMLPGGVTDPAIIQAGEVKLSTQATFDFPLVANKKSLIINRCRPPSLADIELVNVPATGAASILWWNGSSYEGAMWVASILIHNPLGRRNLGSGDAHFWCR